MLHPDCLIHIMEKEAGVKITSTCKASLVANDAGKSEPGFKRLVQDGIIILLDENLEIPSEKMLVMRLQKGFFGKKIIAGLADRQTGVGFMGSRC